MAATDISLLNNVVQVTTVGSQPIAFAGARPVYSFNAAGTILNINFGLGQTYSIALTDLRVAGAGSAPVSAAAAYTALSSVFQK